MRIKIGSLREEEVYEDGVYEMDETQVNQLKDGSFFIHFVTKCSSFFLHLCS